ncbi:hypothetical protein HMPREF9442_03479 [Paraprevotella xylaniphila YIT 11841]|uniref:Uncharacterized protein n=1 Tax=Paraprevotella xylaniphila YIT 11841 TaxID=762982 RepID=F3QZ33_9BACT|nr:hypothetical protein HMPREF9442_03479 [Paraprevotella xylaniphila YIT 11841]
MNELPESTFRKEKSKQNRIKGKNEAEKATQSFSALQVTL